MKTIIIPIAAPMQSWGVNSRWIHRDTQQVPTKSGIIGLVANALGRNREDPIEDLRTLRFGVRTDKPGEILSDFQTVDRGKKTVKNPEGGAVIERKMYLVGALFTAALEGPDALIEQINDAFRHPRGGILRLGRLSCPASGPIIPTVLDTDLENALRTAPPIADGADTAIMPYEYEPTDAERESGTFDTVNDDPVSFHPARREWVSRPVVRVAPENNKFVSTVFDD